MMHVHELMSEVSPDAARHPPGGAAFGALTCWSRSPHSFVPTARSKRYWLSIAPVELAVCWCSTVLTLSGGSLVPAARDTTHRTAHDTTKNLPRGCLACATDPGGATSLFAPEELNH